MVDEASGLASRVTRRLRRRGWTVSTAESCTGGLLASLITDISGATQWFQQGWVVYSNEAKMRELGVEKSAFDQDEAGAVSHEVAVQMARGARYQSGSDVAISITGIAGPKGGTKRKPVGLVFIGIKKDNKTLVRKYLFKNKKRTSIQRAAVNKALNLILSFIK